VTNLDIDVTEACNLGCVYCFKSELYARHMTLATMKRALEWLLTAAKTASTVNCNFMGGEPTLRWKEISAFVPWARRVGSLAGKQVTFSMTSNMTIWTEEIRHFVDAYGFGVLMSIDGHPDVQDAQRPAKNGKKQSETVAYWAKSMLATRPNSTARATLSPTYVDSVAKSIFYLRDLGFREVSMSASMYEKWTDAHFETLREQLRDVADLIVSSYAGDAPLQLTAMKFYAGKLIRHREEGRGERIAVSAQPCGAGKGYLMIDYQGDIWPCHRFDGADFDAKAGGSFRLGNIFMDGFNYELQETFLDFDHSKYHKQSCLTCAVNPICGGYCPAANLSDTGSIYTPHDTFCRWSQLMYDTALGIHRRMMLEPARNRARYLEDIDKAETDGR